MKKIILTFLLSTMCFAILFAESISYKLSMNKPSSHYFEVQMTLKNFNHKYMDIKMPVWSPGSYLVREFAKNVNLVIAKNSNNQEIKVKKINKNTWRVYSDKTNKVIINYKVYSFELTVRTSFLDDTHGYINGSSVFMYVAGHKNESGTLRIIPHKSFKKITTALEPSKELLGGEGTVYTFLNYDELVDSPIEIGNQVEFEFYANGIPHIVAMYGTGNYHIPTLKKDMVKIIESATEVFKENPNKKYTFIIHNTVNGGGGLEHKNSTTLNVNRWTYSGEDYLGFLSLVAHEYFHLWNVKRIRPKELGPFNYDKENYTSLLWVMEGFTSYYDELLLRRAGFYTKDKYLKKLISTINYVEKYPGNKIQPVSHASHDSWIKAYRPNENSRNTTISYYSKGQVLAAIIDMMIIDKFKNKKSLDDFMRLLYKKYYKSKARGFTEEEFKKELSKFLKTDLTDFFNKYVDGVETIPYKDYFAKVSVNLKHDKVTTNNVGLSIKNKGSNPFVSFVWSESDAQNANINVNDEIISIDGYRASKSFVDSYLKSLKEGDEINLILVRDNLIRNTKLKTTSKITSKYQIKSIDKTNKKYKYWLRTSN